MRDTTGQFRDFDDVIFEISDKWDGLDTNTQRYIATVAAGARQQSRFIALVADNERLKELADSAKDSEGSSDRQFNKTLDSLEAKMNKLKTAYHEFILGVLNSDIIKTGVAALTKLFEVLNNISDLAGPFNGFVKTLMLLGTFLGGKALVQGAISLISGGATTSLTGLLGTALGNSAFIQGFLGKSNEPSDKSTKNSSTKNSSTFFAGGTSGKDEGKEKSKPKRGLGTLKTAPGSSIKSSIATSAGGALGSIGGMMGPVGGVLSAVMLITSLIFSIKALIDQRKQKKVDEMQERIDTFNATKETTEANIETYRSIEAEYETLRKGVDEAGKNIGLSAEQYEKFKEMNNQIAEMNPEFITGYDEAGNAILDDHVIELGIELNQEDLDRARETLTTTFSLESIQEGVEVNVEDVEEKYEDLDREIRNVIPEDFEIGITTGKEITSGRIYNPSKVQWDQYTEKQKDILADVDYVKFQQYGAELIAELRQAVRDAEKEAIEQDVDVLEYEPYTEAVEKLDSAIEALDLTDSYLLELEEANQPLIDAMQQYLLRDNIELGNRNLLENLSPEGQVFMNELAKDLVLDGYDITTMKDYLEKASQMMSYGGETGQKYVEAMRNIKKAQEDFLESDRSVEAIEEYNEAITGQYDILEDLAEEYEGSGNKIKELIASFIREQLSSIKDYADETKRTLDGIFDPYGSQIKGVNQMSNTFEEAISDGDYYTGNEQYTEIIDIILDPKNLGGKNASQTFWEGARFLLDDDYLMDFGYNNIQDVYNKIKEMQPLLKPGESGADALNSYLINAIKNADEETALAFEQLGMSLEGGLIKFTNSSDDFVRDLAKILNMDEDALLSAFNNYRQWYNFDFTSPKSLAAGLSNTEEVYKSTSTDGEETYLMDEQKFLELTKGNPEDIVQYSDIIDQAGLTLFDIADTTSEGLQQTMSAFMAANPSFATIDEASGKTTVDFDQAYSMLKQMGYDGFEIVDTLNDWKYDPNIEIPLKEKYGEDATIESLVSDMESTWTDLETSPGLDSIEMTNGELVALNSTASAILAVIAAEDKNKIPEADDRAGKIEGYAENAANADLDTLNKAYEEGLATIKWLEGLEELTGDKGIYDDLIKAVTENTEVIEAEKNKKEKEKEKEEGKKEGKKEANTSTTEQNNTSNTDPIDKMTTDEKEESGMMDITGTSNPDTLRRGQGDYSKEKLKYGQGQYGDYYKDESSGSSAFGIPTISGWPSTFGTPSDPITSDIPTIPSIPSDPFTSGILDIFNKAKNTINDTSEEGKPVTSGILDVFEKAKNTINDTSEQGLIGNFDIKIEEGEIESLSNKIAELTGEDHEVVVEAVTAAANGDLTKLNNLLDGLPTETKAEIISELTGKDPEEVKVELEGIDGNTAETTVENNEVTNKETNETVNVETNEEPVDEAGFSLPESLGVPIDARKGSGWTAIRSWAPPSIKVPVYASKAGNWDFAAKGVNRPAINYGSVAKGHHFGSAAKGHAEGIIGPRGNGGMTLTGELGPEMVWIPSKGKSFLAGVGGPQLLPLPAEAVVYPADMTRKIMDQNRSTPQFGSHAGWGDSSKPTGIVIGGGGSSNKGSSRGSGNRGKAGSEEDKWTNEIDWLYNLLEDINELIREREKLEHRYDMMLEKRNASLSELIDLQNAQLENLRVQQAYEEERLNKREQEMREYLEDNSDLTSKYGITYNWDDRTIEIDWDAIDAIIDEEEGEKVGDMISRLEEIQDEMDEAEDSLMDIEELVAKIEARGKEEFLDLESRIIDALEQIDQNEIDKLEEVNSSINDANSRLMESIRDAVDKSRQKRENQKTEEEIGKTQRRLAYLKQDTSGMNDLEIKELEEQLKEQQENYGDTLVDQKLQEMQDQNNNAAEQRERQIAILEEQLEYNKESGAFAQQAREILVAARDDLNDGKDLLSTTLYQIISQGENWQSKSEEDLIDSKGELNQQLKESSVYLDNRNNENYMKDMQEWMKIILDPKSTNEDKAEAVFQIGQLETQRNLKLNEEEKAKIYGTSTDTAYTDLARDMSKGTSVDYMANMQVALASGDLDTLQINEDLRNKKLQLMGKTNEQTNFYGQALKAQNDNVSLATSGPDYVDYMAKLEEALKVGDFEQAYYWELMRDKKIIQGNLNAKTTGGSITLDAMKNWTPPQQQTSQQQQISPNAGKVSGISEELKNGSRGDQVKELQKALNALGYNCGTVDGIFGSKTLGALKNFQKDMNISQTGKLDSATKEAFKTKGYKTGGLADYTGPAWLDGTPSKPELVLNARDTENFIQLKDILSDLRGFKGKTSQTDRVGDIYYDVQISVDKISNDYDVEKMAEKIKKIIHKDSRYRNVNAINFLR